MGLHRFAHVAVAAAVGCSFWFLSSPASAGESFRISVHSPHGSVSHLHNDAYRRHDKHRPAAREHFRDGYSKDRWFRRDRGADEHRSRHHHEHRGKHGRYSHKKYHRGGVHIVGSVVIRGGHGPLYVPERRTCRYVSRPVTKYYYDRCGNRVHYTDYVRVRVCEHDHHHHH